MTRQQSRKDRAPLFFAGSPFCSPLDVSSKQESERAFRAKPARALRSATRKSGTFLAVIRGAAFVVVALATIWLLRLRHREAAANKIAVVAPVPAALPTFMEINASPWARVLQVQDGEGKSILLPEDGTTPLRLDDSKAGQYKVTLAGPNGDKQIVSCSISGNNHLCMLQIEVPDIQQVMIGANQ